MVGVGCGRSGMWEELDVGGVGCGKSWVWEGQWWEKLGWEKLDVVADCLVCVGVY